MLSGNTLVTKQPARSLIARAYVSQKEVPSGLFLRSSEIMPFCKHMSSLFSNTQSGPSL